MRRWYSAWHLKFRANQLFEIFNIRDTFPTESVGSSSLALMTASSFARVRVVHGLHLVHFHIKEPK
jgi:hypothetical protein